MNFKSECRELTIARRIWLETCVDPVRGLTDPSARKSAIREAILTFQITESPCLTNAQGREFSFGKCFEMTYSEPVSQEAT